MLLISKLKYNVSLLDKKKKAKGGILEMGNGPENHETESDGIVTVTVQLLYSTAQIQLDTHGYSTHVIFTCFHTCLCMCMHTHLSNV